MEIETLKPPGTGATTGTLERPSERGGPDPDRRLDPHDAHDEPRRLSRVGRALAALARWFLLIVLVVLAPVALILWSVTPRVTSPSQLADEAIAAGLTSAVQAALVDQLSDGLTEQEDSPLRAAELRPVIGRSLSQDWVDEQLILLADELDRWLGASGAELPDLVIDLTPVKESLAADDQTLSLISEAMGCNGFGCPSPESALIDMLDEVPDEVALLTIGGESDTEDAQEILTARDRLQTATRLIAMIPLVLAALVVALVLAARRGSRNRWLGAVLVAISVPVLAVATLLPRWASSWVSGSVPGEIPIERTSLEEVFNWAFRPAGSVAQLILIVGAASLVTSVALAVRRRAGVPDHVGSSQFTVHSRQFRKGADCELKTVN
ncbi:MAG: hypothetical protein ACC683_09540 [Acidimicrobiia bacterium]